MDVQPEDQLAAGRILHLLDDPAIARPVGENLILVASERMSACRGEHEPLLADERVQVAALPPQLDRRLVDRQRRSGSAPRSRTGRSRTTCAPRTRRRGRPRGSCPPAGRGQTSRDRAACTPPRGRACTAPTNRSGVPRRSSGRLLPRGFSLRREGRGAGAARHRGGYGRTVRLSAERRSGPPEQRTRTGSTPRGITTHRGAAQRLVAAPDDAPAPRALLRARRTLAHAWHRRKAASASRRPHGDLTPQPPKGLVRLLELVGTLSRPPPWQGGRRRFESVRGLKKSPANGHFVLPVMARFRFFAGTRRGRARAGVSQHSLERARDTRSQLAAFSPSTHRYETALDAAISLPIEASRESGLGG